ncbi:competence protein ComEC [Franzmannia pantelleriensis]|uniref:Competence protein ComEC n=1 Tax=Franzmannia pantelleriensis TaxID=48727 RepID=A0A1G9NQD1_9GAMM|nr:DNA internalization-related competence protein ComEC/Rec2 [Halomonas pantelleriensis]SDL88599.1 competence protein ComEC [Halomonas pantelleriensis]
MRMGWALPLAAAALLGIAVGWLAPAGILEAGLLVGLMAWRHWRWMAWLLVAALSAWPVLQAASASLPQGLSREDLQLEGRLLQVEPQGELTRLLVRVEACRPEVAQRPTCDRLRRVRLTLFDAEAQAPEMRPGERWRFMVRLRPPTGFANPNTFDYAAWLWRERIDATGYVRHDPEPLRMSSAPPLPAQRGLAYLDGRLEEGVARRWLAALTLGVGERLDPDDWTRLNATGTTHLVVISGLHVGLVAAFTLLLGRGVARLAVPGRWRLVTWPWWLAGAAAVGYAMLAGFAPPAQRAMLMTLVGLWVASGRHAPGPWQAWWLALGVVLLLDPIALWRPGLWLSFVAVALLIVIWQGRQRPRGARGWLWALVRTQLLLAPLMAAAVLVAFDRVAPAAPLVNLVAVPLVSILMVPLGLLGWLLFWMPPLSGLCWWLFGLLAEMLHGLLGAAMSWLPAWSPAPWQRWPLALTLILLAMCWALPGLPRRLRLVASLALGLVPLSLAPPSLLPGQLQVRVHDVGQGQLVDLRTANHRLLYDAGPRFRSGFMPLAGLWARPQRFDRVIVSHDDLDHAGGVPALAAHAVGAFMAPRGEQIGVPFEACRAGQSWQWDGVTFSLLWPPPGDNSEWSSNDRSCVLLVEAGAQRVLITGDVGRQVERYFLLDVEAPLTLLVAGHHGSHTSTGPQLVKWLDPHQVVFSAGRDNPYGHPSDVVVRRLRGRCLWNTALDGAVSWRLGDASPATGEPMRDLAAWRGGVGDRCHGVESAPPDAH